jgi:NTE family protein
VDLLRDAAVTQPPAVLHNQTLPSSRAFAVLARTIAGLRVGLALGSGAAKGVAHVGVLAALGRLGVPVDCVTGTSIGALVGSGVALGMDIRQIDETMGRLVDLWAEALRPTLPRFSLVSSKGLDRIVKELTGDVRFDELPIPFGAVATDLNSGRSVNICAGSVALAVRASISIPLIFPPVFDGSYCLVDGFVTNPIPTKLARDLGGDVILAVNLGRPPDDGGLSPIQYEERARGDEARRQSAPNILETYLRCADIMMTGRGENDCLSADLAFRPRLPQISWREFQKGGPAMEAGEAAVEESKDALRELLPWLKHGG